MRFGYCRVHYKNRKKRVITVSLLILGYFVFQLVVPTAFGTYIWEKVFPDKPFECSVDKIIGAPIFDTKFYSPKILKVKIANNLSGTPYYLKLDSKQNQLDTDLYCVYAKPTNEPNCSLRYRISEDGEILLSGEIFDFDGSSAVVIEDNWCNVNNDCKYMFNNDKNGLEIVDNHLNVLFSLDIIKDNEVELLGTIMLGQKQMLFNGTSWAIKYDKGDPKMIDMAKSIPRKFKYSGPRWRGERLK